MVMAARLALALAVTAVSAKPQTADAPDPLWLRYEPVPNPEADLDGNMRLSPQELKDYMLAHPEEKSRVVMGPEFTESPPAMMADVFADATPKIPIIFILSTGADPTDMMDAFAAKMGMTDNYKVRITILILLSSDGWDNIQNKNSVTVFSSSSYSYTYSSSFLTFSLSIIIISNRAFP